MGRHTRHAHAHCAVRREEQCGAGQENSDVRVVSGSTAEAGKQQQANKRSVNLQLRLDVACS